MFELFNPLRLVTALCAGILVCPSRGTTQESYESLNRAYQAEHAELERKLGRRANFGERTQLTRKLAAAIESYLKRGPRDDDRVRARLALAGMYLNFGDRPATERTLTSFEVERASLAELMDAAVLADAAGLREQRTQWIEAAMVKPADFAARMQAGTTMMTRLVEVERGRKIFDDALAGASDDEQRATVLWHLAAATREREDRADDDYARALEQVATRFPNTRFGSIAADRLRAMVFEIGSPAVELRGVDRDGKTLALSDFRNRVVLVCFWDTSAPTSRAVLTHLQQLNSRFKSDEFMILGIALATDTATAGQAIEAHALDWPNLVDRPLLQSDLAMRCNVEHTPHMFLVDRNGKIAGLRLYLHDEEEVRHLATLIKQALD